jgi:hypothetical protein
MRCFFWARRGSSFCYHRAMRYVLFIALGISLLLTGGVHADEAKGFAKIVEICKAGKEKAVACEKAVWDFADVVKDDKLTIAEVSRLIRGGAVYAEAEIAKKQKAQGQAATGLQGQAVLLGYLLGPMAAPMMVYNFDYDGDGKIARTELYADYPEGKMVDFVLGFAEGDWKSKGLGVGQLLSMLPKNILGGAMPGLSMKPPTAKTFDFPAIGGAVAAMPKMSAMPKMPVMLRIQPLHLVEWTAQFVRAGGKPQYKMRYTLRNHLQKDVKRIDGTLWFKDKQGRPFFAVKIAKTKGVREGTQATLGGDYPLDLQSSGHLKLRDMSKLDIEVEIKIDRVEFGDGSSRMF